MVSELEVNTPGITTAVRKLSGGNVQKVMVGREISSAPTVLLTAYAVRGLDINSSYTIYDLINKQKEKGVDVVYVGEDLDVLAYLAIVIAVLCGFILKRTRTGLAVKELYKMLPYVITIVVLVISFLRNKRENQPPASLGLPYFREDR